MMYLRKTPPHKGVVFCNLRLDYFFVQPVGLNFSLYLAAAEPSILQVHTPSVVRSCVITVLAMSLLALLPRVAEIVPAPSLAKPVSSTEAIRLERGFVLFSELVRPIFSFEVLDASFSTGVLPSNRAASTAVLPAASSPETRVV